MSDLEAWAALLALGAFHGINPAMGWLFAVALGLQEQKCRAALQSLVPIALGHALAIGVVVMAAAIIHEVAPLELVRWPVGVGLILFGAFKFFRSRHPRWVGMRVSFKDLVAWSFLMASAHGAGLMLVPVLLGWAAGDVAQGDHAGMAHVDHAGHGAQHAEHLAHAGFVGATPILALLATAVHTLGYLAVTGIIAVVVYQKVGLAILRKAWFNLDIVWSLALVMAGIATVAI